MSNADFVYMTVIAAPPEQVWQGLTTAEFTEQYWHATRVRSEFTPGATIEFLNPDGSAGVAGEILTADRPSELSRPATRGGCLGHSPRRVPAILTGAVQANPVPCRVDENRLAPQP